VDLSRAFQVVGSPTWLPGQSDDDLVKRVQEMPNFAEGSKPPSAAVGLEQGVTLLPLEALHWLSLATRPRYQDDLLDTYLYWALTRYIGLFEHIDQGLLPPTLTLSDAGQRVVGNQRRVTSEEMGIGFGALLASRWFWHTGAAGLPVSIIDVDAALDDRYVFAGGAYHAVRASKARRPDYLLVAPDPSSRRNYRVRAVECKGTCTSTSYALRQLARAAGQLTGITVGGRTPRGLAVSTITKNDHVSYLAIDPEEDDEPSYPVDSATIDQAAGFQLQDDVADVPPGVLANASVRASWAVLADFSGNLAALDRWAPAVMRRRLGREPRQRAPFETPYGDARGTSATVTINGQIVRLTYGIQAEIDDLMTGPAEAITDAQLAFAEQVAPSADMETAARAEPSNATAARVGLQATGVLYSATPDGSIFALAVG
jgi:hypothetical protein